MPTGSTLGMKVATGSYVLAFMAAVGGTVLLCWFMNKVSARRRAGDFKCVRAWRCVWPRGPWWHDASARTHKCVAVLERWDLSEIAACLVLPTYHSASPASSTNRLPFSRYAFLGEEDPLT